MNNKLWVKKKWDDATFAFNLHLISFQIADIKVKNLVTANQPIISELKANDKTKTELKDKLTVTFQTTLK